ncbi:MAG TPA: hypothetical protein VI756_20805, partial [Blastocatellia bacterium]
GRKVNNRYSGIVVGVGGADQRDRAPCVVKDRYEMALGLNNTGRAETMCAHRVASRSLIQCADARSLPHMGLPNRLGDCFAKSTAAADFG